MSMITARRIAEEVGVSVSTVGRALADDPRISVETKTKVRAVADQLGYVTSTPARVMRGGSSRLVGLMLPNMGNEFYSAIADSISASSDADGYQVVFSVADNRDIEARHVKELISSRVSGIIIVPTASPKQETADLLRNFPHVQLLRRIRGWSSPWFGIDDEACTRLSASHLLGLGHTRIVYIGGMTSLSTGKARVEGLRQAYANAGVGFEACQLMLGYPSYEFGHEAIAQVLGQSTRPTAVIAGSVQITQAVLEALHRQKVSVPRELSVVGFGDSPSYAWWGNGLTTLNLPVRHLATTCGLWFLHRIKRNITDSEQYESMILPSLIMRGSTASV